MSAIKVRELMKLCGDKVVVDDVSFSVEEGELTAGLDPLAAALASESIAFVKTIRALAVDATKMQIFETVAP